ncbi:hypothetical protein EDB19DRAFT_1922367 [Suillus lakei]|nr:hypothetical protein EDB19DRAFT_1922367 [Suillus lakei]
MDLAQSSRIGSTEPRSPRKFDRVKKGLEEDRGYLSDGGKVSIAPPSLQVFSTDAKPCTAAPNTTHPHLPPAQLRLPAQYSQMGSRRKFFSIMPTSPYYGFTNFSSDPIEYNGKKYPTSEHLFQSLKFMERRPELAEHIRTCSTRPACMRIEMMDLVLWQKFTQNRHLKEELLSTGDAELVEVRET